MTDIDSIKNRLIDDLWLSIVKEGGEILYPKRKINKQMKMLTLTRHNNCRELEEFIKNKVTKKELIIGWNRETNEAIRLEVEKLESAKGGYVYEDAIRDSQSEIQDDFPFDILNLDFTSQKPELEDERIEKEILGIENTIKMQSDKGNKGMVLIYTTILTSTPLNLQKIKRESDSIWIQGRDRLSTDGFSSNTMDNNNKIRCIKGILTQIFSKYKYNHIVNIGYLCLELSNGSGDILSIAALLKRS